ncbi:sensor domain-containing phosphodiesterase [Noviherbaspirillum sp. ST9]|uniref:sensor domain-containing phosphodiesterase n=1 Tax=Noviherbaspirillum sp. ST9 TaxID=3401606 RepID=UPI003B585DA4
MDLHTESASARSKPGTAPNGNMHHCGRNTDSPDTLISDALHAVRTLLDMDVAFVSEFNGGRRIFRYVDSSEEFTSVSANASDPLEETYCQRVLDGRMPELIADTAKNPEALKLAITSHLHIGNYLGVPIRFSDGAVYGTFCCFSTQANHALNNQHLETVRLFANFVGKVVERHSLADLRKESRARLNKVLEEERFDIHYQPIIHVSENRLVGHEALARFSCDPIRTPDCWFSEAAEVGCQEALELAVIRKALSALPHLPQDTYVSVNVSPETVLKGSISTVLDGYPLERIVLEMTEHALVDDYSSIARQLAFFRRKGLRLAVDDAGAGFASFRHILKLKPDIIKLDSSLIQRIDIDVNSRALAAALIRFAEETGSKIVAEGVETESELSVLRELKVNKVQGFLLGRPRPIYAH